MDYINHRPSLIEKYPDKPWDLTSISADHNTTWSTIQNNLDKPWNWYEVSRNPNITWFIICDNPDEPWDWKGVPLNPNVTWEIIYDNPDKPWRGLSFITVKKDPKILKRQERQAKQFIYTMLLEWETIPEVINKLICDFTY